jgi:hypothetical protein
MKRLIPVLILFLATIGCDPGWKYNIAGKGKQIHNSYITEDLLIKVDGSLFALLLSIDIEIMNKSKNPLKIDVEKLRAEDAKNVALAGSFYCNNPDYSKVIILNPNQSCLLSADFEVNPLTRIFYRPNPDLRIINVYLDELVRKEKKISLHIQLQWDLEK